MVRLLALLVPLTFLMLSGCADDPPAAAGDDGAAPDSAAGPADPSQARFIDEEGEPVATREEPLQVSGRSATGVCGGMGGVTGQCVNDLGDGNLQPLDRAALAVQGTLTWAAASPATEVMGVLVLVPCGDGCWTSDGESPYVYGASPLAVDFDLSGVDERAALWFSSYQGTNAAGAWGGVSTPQDFSFEGTVVVAA